MSNGIARIERHKSSKNRTIPTASKVSISGLLLITDASIPVLRIPAIP